MAGTWIVALTVAVFSAQHCYTQEYYGPCSRTNELAPYPGNCNLFLTCVAAGYFVVQRCAANTVFDIYSNRCDYRVFVPNCRDNVTQSPCSQNPCVYGTCNPTNQNSQGYTCTCYPGYTGVDCSQDINECTQNPWLCNSGSCINTLGSFVCDCTNTAYTGKYCETLIDPCSGSPCSNGGQCINTGTGSYFCNCTGTGYSGVNCTSLSNTCNPHPCGPGRCIGNDRGFVCDCAGTNFEGDFCGVPKGTIDSCNPHPCGPGRCTGTDRELKCDCRGTGYEGTFCQLPILCSTYNPCLNGVCLNVSGLPFCECKNTGYTGLTCASPVANGNYCFDKACANGVCVNQPDSYTCSCSGTIYFGRMCNFTACNAQSYGPCLNGGECIPQTGADYTCVCPPYLTGKNCSQLVNPGNCPAHHCPSNVPKYNYPNWSDRTCQSYYACQNGFLQLQTCSSNQKFDVLSMLCKSSDTQPAVYCDAFRA